MGLLRLCAQSAKVDLCRTRPVRVPAFSAQLDGAALSLSCPTIVRVVRLEGSLVRLVQIPAPNVTRAHTCLSMAQVAISVKISNLAFGATPRLVNANTASKVTIERMKISQVFMQLIVHGYIILKIVLRRNIFFFPRRANLVTSRQKLGTQHESTMGPWNAAVLVPLTSL